MSTLPLTEVRNRLSELVDDVERTHERVVITRHGRDSAVIMSTEDVEAMEETLDILGNQELMQQIAKSREDLATGNVLDAEGLAALMEKRRQDR